LINVLAQGAKVQLLGAADRSLIGHPVAIRYAGKKVVATAVVGPDGFFTANAPMPPKRERNTNRARYIAMSGADSSLNLKLMRRLVMQQPTAGGGKVTLTGRVVPPLTRPVSTVIVQQQVDCQTRSTAAKFRPNPNGTFRIMVAAPAGKAAVIYRLATRVKTNSKSSRTFSLPIAVNLR
jgi:hypothetical protein